MYARVHQYISISRPHDDRQLYLLRFVVNSLYTIWQNKLYNKSTKNRRDMAESTEYVQRDLDQQIDNVLTRQRRRVYIQQVYSKLK